MRLDVVIPIEVTRGLNAREHHYARAKRVKAEREAVNYALCSTIGERVGFYAALSDYADLGARVTLLRPYARTPLDSDNLSGAFKGVRDEVASFLGVDDKSERVHWRYCQCKAQKVAMKPRSEGATKGKAPLDTHVRCRIEIVPAADVDPLKLAVRVLRAKLDEVRTDLYMQTDWPAVDEVIAHADQLATFDPQELYR